MTHAREVNVSDVIAAFQNAKGALGLASAMDVVRRFGGEYAATIPAANWWAAVMALNTLARKHDTLTAEDPVLTPDAVKSKWQKPIAAE